MSIASGRTEVIRQDIDRIRLLDGVTVEEAAQAVRDKYTQLGLPLKDIGPIINTAVAKIKTDLEKVDILRVGRVVRAVREKWYSGPQSTHQIWPGLHSYLQQEKGWDADTVGSIDQSSTRVLSLLHNPGTPAFKTRGLVVGYVQSGKTANMTAVMAKAADVGFRFFIVLAGMTDALRQQTQLRLQKDLVSRTPDRWHWKTSVECDFQDNLIAGFAATQPHLRHIAVIKKNKWILEKLLKKLGKTSSSVLAGWPFLIIDDECDQASVNAARYREDITAINGLIRGYLSTLPRIAYIGYTATPFANVLIDPAVSVDPEKPDDLYPKDFIFALPRPSAYFGAERLFGRDLLEADDVPPDKQGLDMIRDIPADEIPSLRPASASERFDFVPDVAPSLVKALHHYLLATAVRICRGQGHEHSSMLVHTTCYVFPHFTMCSVLEDWLADWHKRLRNDDPELLAELRADWEEEVDRVPASQFARQRSSFVELRTHLLEVAETVSFVVENGESAQRLDFGAVETENGFRGRRYIVIGGNVLARGLTIEGLVVSFFLRSSSQYDTLMQMGRWFGYRVGWEDLPRIWMSTDIKDAFRKLALVEAEIRYDMEIYERDEITPLDFAVRIRQLPGLRITARNKMHAAQESALSFANRQLQTRRFRHLDPAWLDSNWRAGAMLVESANNGVKRDGAHVFKDVPVSSVLLFLGTYQIHASHSDFETDALIDYIRSQNDRTGGALALWNLAVVTPEKGTVSQDVFGPLGKVQTSVRSEKFRTKENDVDIKALMSRRDIVLDMDGAPTDLDWSGLRSWRWHQTKTPLLLLYPIDRVSNPKPAYEKSRKPLNAVKDVLGLGLLFPPTNIDTPVKYREVALPQEEFEMLDEEVS